MPGMERRDERREDRRDGPNSLQGPVGGLGAAKRYQMTQRMAFIGNEFWIEDERGEIVFKIDGNARRVRHALLFCDAQGRPLCQIQECVLPVQDSVEIEGPNGKSIGKVKKVLISPMRERWVICLRNNPDLDVKGNILDHEYRIERELRRVAEVSKQWFRLRNSYGVQIYPGQDDILILAATVAIDMMAYPHR